MKKLRQIPGMEPEKLAKLAEAFRAFHKEGTIRKGQVQNGKMKLSSFLNWLLEQRDCSIS